jgi:hypothetical protein
MIETQNTIEKALVSALLFESAGKASAILDTFSGWLLGGLAAATTLLISQFDSAAKHLSLEAIRCCLFLFLLSVAVALIEKYLSSVILAGSASAAIGREMVSKAPFNAGNLNIEVIFSEIARAMFQPASWFVKRSFAKVKEGDFTAAAINFTRCLQIQGFLVLVQAALLLGAIYTIYHGSNVYFHSTGLAL